jgi:vacuolar-type H+-ATPase subunit C/Vma6
MRWDDVNARAVGLASHLLRREQLLDLLAVGTWLAAARRLIDLGVPVDSSIGTPADLDRAIGRLAARRLAILDRWLGARRTAAAVIYEDEDRRNLRALLRGAAQGAPPTLRLRSCVPTPGLPELALERLAQAGSPGELIRRLVRQGHPAGRALASVEPAIRPDGGLFGLELALSKAFAARASRLARRGGRLVRRFAQSAVDRENGWSLLSASGWATDRPAETVFLEGGRELPLDTFKAVAALGDPDRVRDRLAIAFGRGPLAPVFADRSAAPASLESRALAARVAWCRAEGRREPLGPGVCFAAIERIRGEAHDLRLVLGGLALGATPEAIEPLLVTAA